jgi:hypothetical protein
MESQNASFSSLSRPIESYLSPNERTILTGVYVVLSSLGLFGNGVVIYVNSDRPPYGGIYNELAKSMTSLFSANNLADFIMSLQNL